MLDHWLEIAVIVPELMAIFDAIGADNEVVRLPYRVSNLPARRGNAGRLLPRSSSSVRRHFENQPAISEPFAHEDHPACPAGLPEERCPGSRCLPADPSPPGSASQSPSRSQSINTELSTTIMGSLECCCPCAWRQDHLPTQATQFIERPTQTPVSGIEFERFLDCGLSGGESREIHDLQQEGIINANVGLHRALQCASMTKPYTTPPFASRMAKNARRA
jgi:hypothetical protein